MGLLACLDFLLLVQWDFVRLNTRLIGKKHKKDIYSNLRDGVYYAFCVWELLKIKAYTKTKLMTTNFVRDYISLVLIKHVIPILNSTDCR